MPILASANNIQKSFGNRTLFSGLTFVIEDGDRIGLIGPNGMGKSTLLKMLAGETTPDHGEISTRRGLRIGWLEQVPRVPNEKTIEIAVLDSAFHPGEGTSMSLASELMSRLELTAFAQRKVGELSGGWKKRVALACELMKEPELLLLDEPTNHLDIESILWLEAFLAKSSFATLTVTHDRLFLQRASNRIIELDKRNPGGLLSVAGDYATYLQRKEELLTQQELRETKLKNTLRRETEWLRQGAKARTTKQKGRIQAAERLMETVAELEERNQTQTIGITFQSTNKKPKRLIEARKISKSLGGKCLFKDLDLFLGPGSRAGLLGRNGCGKSTLIRTLLDLDKPDSGLILRSDHLKIAYFEQNRDTLDPEQTLRKTLCPAGDHVSYRGDLVHIHGYLDRFLFRKEQVDMRVGALSGGEQSRVLIARLMLQEANVLVLDEPTNDLDTATLDVLEECLTGFDGAILLVTHDRYFLDHVATTILGFSHFSGEEGEITAFSELSQWEDWHNRKSKPEKKASPVVQAKAPEKKKGKLSFNESRELAQMEGKIAEAEERLASLQKEASLPGNLSHPLRLGEIYKEIASAQAEVERLYARWAELEEK